MAFFSQSANEPAYKLNATFKTVFNVSILEEPRRSFRGRNILSKVTAFFFSNPEKHLDRLNSWVLIGQKSITYLKLHRFCPGVTAAERVCHVFI